MNKVSMKVITTGIMLGACSLAAAHGGSHTELTPLHFLTNPDHMSIFALITAGAAALIARRTVSHLRKAPSRKQ